eukprot:8034868-Alexandrium_andersonii.AAC.1
MLRPAALAGAPCPAQSASQSPRGSAQAGRPARGHGSSSSSSSLPSACAVHEAPESVSRPSPSRQLHSPSECLVRPLA